MKAITCPICASVSYRYFDHTDYFGAPVSIYKCSNCGHGSYDKWYADKDLKAIYQQDYTRNYLETENIAAIRRADQYCLDLQYLVRFFDAPSETKVLDYGCSGGGFLDTMPESWRKFGYEVNPTYLEYLCENKPQIHVYKSLSEVDELFDLITMRGVIEHIQQHDNVIEFIQKRLVDGGGLFISATPDFSSVCACLYKEKWNQILCPSHIHQFTISSLALLMARAGLVLRHLSHPYSETPYAFWEKDSKAFLSNSAEKHDHCFPSVTQHAFPGNMMTAFFEKVALR